MAWRGRGIEFFFSASLGLVSKLQVLSHRSYRTVQRQIRDPYFTQLSMRWLSSRQMDMSYIGYLSLEFRLLFRNYGYGKRRAPKMFRGDEAPEETNRAARKGKGRNRGDVVPQLRGQSNQFLDLLFSLSV